MSIFRRRKNKTAGLPGAASQKELQAQTTEHLRVFVEEHAGCEAFIEPQTTVTQTTLVVVADTGEWTRRRVPDADTAKKLSKNLGIPVFDVNLSGYPSRMREWNEKQRKNRG